MTERKPPGTTKLHRLEENVGGALIDITADDLREIGEVLAKVPVQVRVTARRCRSWSIADLIEVHRAARCALNTSRSLGNATQNN